MNLIQNTILNSLPANKKKTPSGWISFNAPCCIYNGETQDKKKRGGIMTSELMEQYLITVLIVAIKPSTCYRKKINSKNENIHGLYWYS